MSSLQQDLFLPTACNPCLLKPFITKPEKLSRCLGCRLILYCSVNHQKIDWRIHRPFCHAASAILTKYSVDHLFHINGPIKNQEDLNITTLMVKYALKSLLNRSLSFHEEELTSFPVMCAVCYSTDMSKLFQCKTCNAISFCSEEHEKQYAPIHRVECLPLKIYYCKFKINPGLQSKITFKGRCNILCTDLTKSIRLMYGIEIPEDPTQKAVDYQKFSFVSDFSFVATITYVMKHLDLLTYLGDQFNIYVAGATVDEIFFTPVNISFFFIYFPQIRKLNLIFVGPEIREPVEKESKTTLDDGRTLYKLSYKGKLEEYFAENPGHLKPNIIVCFNCGFSENAHNNNEGDHWYNALRYMMELPEIPIVFTSYTSLEADFDYGAMMKVIEERKGFNNVRLERIVVKQRNPYRDLRPLRSWAFNDPERIFYRNGYVQAVRVRLNDC